MAAIHKSLEKRSAKNMVFYEDAVDIHSNPQIGSDWQLRDKKNRAVTLGKNE